MSQELGNTLLSTELTVASSGGIALGNMPLDTQIYTKAEIDASLGDVGKAILEKGGGYTGSPLPYDCEIEYLESTGTQYIDTGIVPAQTTKIKFAYLLTQAPTDSFAAAFGCLGATGGAPNVENMYSGFALFNNPSVPVQARVGKNTAANIVSDISVAANVRYEGEVQFGRMQLNGTEYTQSGSGSWITMTRTICTHAANDDSSTFSRRFVQARFFSFSISDGSTLVRDFVPVKKNGVGYLYDKVSGQLFGNAGTGSFVCGPVVGLYNIPANVTRIRYLESTGTQYVDTLTPMDGSLRVVMDYVCYNTLVRPFGAADVRGTVKNQWYLINDRNQAVSNCSLGSTTNANVNIGQSPVGVRTTSTIDGRTLSAYGGTATELSWTLTPRTDDCTLGIFACHVVRTDGSNPWVLAASMRLYSLLIYDGSTLVRSFVPVRVGTVGYLFDRVSGQLFGNSGTGNFVLGPDDPVLPEHFSQYGDAVRDLPCSLDALPLEDEEATWCIFVDCDGQVVAVFNKTQTRELSALPKVPAPPFDGLINGIWNWTLAEVKASTLPMCIGPLYDTNDGKSWIKIRIPENGYEWHAYSRRDASSYGRIDWGDGSTEESLTSGLLSHTYTSAGDYVVKVYSTRGNQDDCDLGNNSMSICGKYNTNSYPKFREDMACITDAAIMWSYCPAHTFGEARNMRHVVFRTAGGYIAGQGFGHQMLKLRQISIRRDSTGIADGGTMYPLNNASSLQCVCYSPSVIASGDGFMHHQTEERLIRCPYSNKTGNIRQNGVDANRSLRIIRIPGDMTLGSNNIFNGDVNLRKIIFVENGTAPTVVNSSVFTNCWNLEKLENLSLASITTLGSNAFASCISLWKDQSVSFPSLTSIGQNALNNTAAREFIIGSAGTTLTTSSTGQFGECLYLKRVKFNGDVSKVMGNFFLNDRQLSVVDFSGCTTVPPLDNVNAFGGTVSLEKIIVPDSLYSTWIAASNWSSTTNNIVNCIVKASEA